MNNKLIIAAVLSAAFAANVASAQEAAAPAATPPHNQFAFNVGLTSDYRYRGISQSRLGPAISGGIDYTHNPTGFYVGTWASSIKWISDAGGDGDAEIDLYGGKRGEIVKDVTYDLGLLRYIYPGNDLGVNADTTEAYGQFGYGPAYIKYSHSLTNTFGFEDSKNSNYIDIGANIDVGGGYTVNLHAGHQKIKGPTDGASYSDWKVGVTREFYGVTVSLAAIGTNAEDDVYYGPYGEHTGKIGAVLTLTKAFQ
jgi:uncharacterized protein (TIGR02001 family)